MTINKAIEIINQTHPSQYDYATQVGWLSDLDKRAYEVLQNHEETKSDLTFPGYDEDTDGDAELKIGSPYDEVYPIYLDMKVSLSDRDYSFYNNAAALFETAWRNWTDYINRTYHPVRKTAIFNFKGKRDVHNS